MKPAATLPSTATMSVVMVKHVIRAFGALGGKVDYDKAAAKYCIDPELLKDDDNRVPNQVLYDMAASESERLNDPVFGFRLAQHIDMKSMRWFKELFFVARTVKDALQIFNRYHHIFVEMAALDVTQSEGRCDWAFNAIEPDKVNYHVVDGVMAVMYRLTDIFGGGGVLSVDFSHPCPEGSEAFYQNYFKVPVKFNQPTTCFHLKAEWLDMNIEHFEEPTYKKLAVSEKRLARVKGVGKLEDQVRFILGKMLVTGEVSINSMADAMDMQLRTFQRRLKAENISYKDLVEETRKGLTMEYLFSGEYSVNEIAFLVGYSDAPSFFRAFKAWTGMAPGQYRELHLCA